MLGLLIIFSFWIAITIFILIPFILTLTIGSFIAKKLDFNESNYYLFMILFYLITLCILIVI